MKDWTYGDSWEKYPIEADRPWVDLDKNSILQVADLRYGMPYFMQEVDLLYTDPPWNLALANGFLSKAGTGEKLKNFEEFSGALFHSIAKVGAEVCYLEIGEQWKDDFIARLESLYSTVHIFQITYGKKHPAWLLRGGDRLPLLGFGGMDDEQIPLAVAEREPYGIMGDLCTGRGLSALAALKAGRPFRGTELNKRRLAVTIDRCNKAGGAYKRWEQ
jgi:hypothetical protein